MTCLASAICKNIDLLQWLYGVQRLPRLVEFPVLSQFFLMKIVPVEYSRQRSPRKPSLDNTAIDLVIDNISLEEWLAGISLGNAVKLFGTVFFKVVAGVATLRTN